MRTLGAMFLGCALVAVVAVNVLADDKKEEKAASERKAGPNELDIELTGAMDDGGDASPLPDKTPARNLWNRKDYVWPAPARPEEVEAYWREAAGR